MKIITRLPTFIVITLCCGLTQLAFASDLEKEKRWREQIVDAIFDGEPITLNNGQHDFLAIYTEGDGSRKTGLIIMHGIGIHPDYPTVIHPLRVGLAEQGWATLSLQLPILPNDAASEDYDPLIPQAASRVQAGIEYLRAAGMPNSVIIAHSLGTIMAADAIQQSSDHITGFIAIGMGYAGAPQLEFIQMPVLDIYGSDDLGGVVASATDRKSAAAHNQDYTQTMVPDADHFFEGQEEALIQIIADWLDSRAK